MVVADSKWKVSQERHFLRIFESKPVLSVCALKTCRMFYYVVFYKIK